MGVGEIIIYSFLSIWGAYITYLLLEVFFDTSEVSIKRKIIMFGTYNLITEIVYFGWNIPMLTLSVSTIFMITIGCVYSKNKEKIAIAIILTMLIISGMEGIAVSLAKYEHFFLFSDNPLASTESVFLTRITGHLIALGLVKLKNIKSEIDIYSRYNLAIVGVAAISLYVIVLLISYREIGIIWRAIGIIGMLIISIGVFYLYDIIKKSMHIKVEKLLYQKESEYYQNQVEIIKISSQQDQKIRHDIKNNLIVIKSLIENNEGQKAIEYMKSIVNYYEAKNEISKTGLIIVDSILNYKLSKAEEQSIKYKLNTSIPENINIDSFDIGVLLGNILDNALDALEKVEKDNRYLNIDILYQQESLKIIVENSYNGIINTKNGQISTTKSDTQNHGQGLKIINSIATKYGDYVNINHDAERFKISVLLLENQS